MKRRFLTLVAAPFAFAPATAMAQATVSGEVVDDGGRGLSGAAVAVLGKATGAAISGAVTSEGGRFVLPGLPVGEYSVTVSHGAHQSASRDLVIGTRNTVYALGRIRLRPAAGGAIAAEVAEVVVLAERTGNVAPGVNIISMDANIVGAGGSVLDAMKSLPGVTIDQEGVVQLRGSDRVPILIDGKPSSLTGYGNQSGLDAIPAANIDRIEVINNPSAKHDAAGMAGVINIIFKQDRKLGLHGEVGLTGGVGAITKRRPDLPSPLGSYSSNPRIIPSFNLNYTTPDVAYHLQGQAMVRRDLPNNEFTSRFYDDGRIRYSQIPENREQVQASLKGGLDWTLPNKDTLTFSGVVDWERHIDQARIPFIDEGGVRRRYWFWKEDENTGFINGSLAYKHELGAPGHHLTARVQYTRGWEDETYKLNEESAVRIGTDQTHVIATEHIVPVTLDYVRPLGSGRLEAGAKLQLRWIPVTYDVIRGQQSVIYAGMGDETEWRENIYAVYANLVWEKAAWAVEGGARLEQTEVAYDVAPDNIYYAASDQYDYAKVFGNLRVTWKASDSSSLSVFYNNRVDRPGEQELRIFPKYDDPELLKVGNPFLRPQFTRTLELAYKQLWGKTALSAALFHRDIEGAFTRLYAEDLTNPNYEIINKIYANTGHSTQTGVELTASAAPAAWWKASASLNAYRNSIDPYRVVLDFPYRRTVTIRASEDTTWDAKLNNSFRLPGRIELQISGVYYAPRNVAQGTQSARSSVDIGATKKLWDEKVEIVFAATDIFNQFGIEQEIDGDGFTAVYRNFNQTQIVSLGLKYAF